MKKDIILQLSVRSIRLNFLRSVLAAIGIVIGVVAIASMGMMGANMTMSVTEQLSAMANVLVVKADTGGGGGFFGGGRESHPVPPLKKIVVIHRKYDRLHHQIGV